MCTDDVRANFCSDSEKLIGQCFTVQIDNDLKHTVKATKELLGAKKCKIQSPDLDPAELLSTYGRQN